jgi:hypothetical protein
MTTTGWSGLEADEDSHAPEPATPRRVDLTAFADRHDIAIGEAREIISLAGADLQRADTLANRAKKW